MTTVIVAPDIVLKEFDDFYRVSANVHGLSLNDIAVNIAVGMLTLSGQRQSREGDRGAVAVAEAPGSFLYNVELPDDIDTQAVSGWLEHGVLTMTIGRAQECFI